MTGDDTSFQTCLKECATRVYAVINEFMNKYEYKAQ